MILIEGQKIFCSLSNSEIDLKADNYIYFPNIIVNEKSELYSLNDSFILNESLEKSNLKEEIRDYLELHKQESNNIDYITNEELRISNFDNPDNIIELPIFTIDKNNPCYKYNKILINKKNIGKWADKSTFLAVLNDLNKSKSWGGNYILELIKILEDKKLAPPLKDWMIEDIKNKIKSGNAQWWMKF